MTRLTLPPADDPQAAVAWVARHLDGSTSAPAGAAPLRGGQRAADAALAALDATGYAARRNEVWPPHRRGATGLSPYIRHGLLSLPRVWTAAAHAPSRDRDKLRDELLWQEYARHLYARLGPATGAGLRRHLPARSPASAPSQVWDPTMACLALATEELAETGTVVNQVRMWLASHWAVRIGADWRAGEDVLYRQLLDGSRAANRAGWQWTAGTATGRPYGFTRRQVERRAPGICAGCSLRDACPIETPPADPPLQPTTEHPLLRRDPDPAATAGPRQPVRTGRPARVWLTAESLGDADPALAAHPELPVVFVFDAPLLRRLQLSGQRLVFLVETLAELATRRELHVHLDDPVTVLAGQPLAVTAAPVPGARHRRAALDIAALHPWPWLVPPHGGSLASYSAWRKAARLPR